MATFYRPATAADTPAIRTLLEQSGLPTESLDRQSTEFFVAEENGGIIGVAGFEFYSPDALLRSVAIAPGLRSKGRGADFVTWMINLARGRGSGSVVLLTETARVFFERLGFSVTDRALITNSAMKASSEFTFACPISAVCMILPFSPPRE